MPLIGLLQLAGHVDALTLDVLAPLCATSCTGLPCTINTGLPHSANCGALVDSTKRHRLSVMKSRARQTHPWRHHHRDEDPCDAPQLGSSMSAYRLADWQSIHMEGWLRSCIKKRHEELVENSSGNLTIWSNWVGEGVPWRAVTTPIITMFLL